MGRLAALSARQLVLCVQIIRRRLCLISRTAYTYIHAGGFVRGRASQDSSVRRGISRNSANERLDFRDVLCVQYTDDVYTQAELVFFLFFKKEEEEEEEV